MITMALYRFQKFSMFRLGFGGKYIFKKQRMKEGKRKEGEKDFPTELTFERVSSDLQANNERSVQMSCKD